MSARLHAVTEQLAQYVKNLPEPHKQDGELTLAAYKKLVNNAVQFDFGDDERTLPGEQECVLYNYALELCEHDIFSLPYENVFYTSTWPVSNLRAHDTFACQKEGSKLCIINIGLTTDLTIIYTGHVIFDIVTGETKGRFHSPYNNREDMHAETARFVVQRVLAYTAMLQAECVELKHTPASEKQNKARIKRGKPPILACNEVILRVNGVRYNPSGAPSVGSHGSPRAHWRRGHVRRLQSGKLTTVKPCLVAFVSGAAPEAPIYRLQPA